MKVSLFQLNSDLGNLKINSNKIIKASKKAISEGADMIITPELSLCGYPPEDLLLNNDFILECDKHLKKIINAKLPIKIILGYPKQIGTNLFNAASIIFNGKILKTYLKQTLPNYGVFDEKRYFKEGDKGLIFNHKRHKIGILICEDLWVDEPLEKLISNKVNIIICINASPFELSKQKQRLERIEKKIKNKKIKLIYLNSVGGQDDLVFDGGSIIYDGEKNIFNELPQFEEKLKIFNLNDLTIQDRVKNSQIEILYKGLCLSLKDYLSKNKISKIFLGLSGGIDSAVVLCIAAQIFNKKNINAIMMPTKYTSKESLLDAKKLAQNLSVNYSVKKIDSLINKLNNFFNEDFKNLKEDITEENLQARARGVILMAYANKLNGMVLATSNKSEVAVGYATVYGDMVGGFSVLKDVPKTMVYQLANFINQKKEIIPQNIISRAPTAELKFNQTDQDSLPSYDILDNIIDLVIEQNLTSKDIIKLGYDAHVVKKVVKSIHANEFKRRQAAPGPKITFKAFGKDRRYPITNNFK
jgi:NAD+ synthase (glutamine-hydrolysing)